MTAFIVPGSIDTATGGFRYDRRIVAEWRRAGHPVTVIELDGRWPHPDDADRARADACLAAIDDGTTVVVDGLAYGALPTVVARHASRLRLVALVHHPLWMEADPLAGGAGQPPPADSAPARDEMAALAHARRVIVTSRDTALAVGAMGVTDDRIAVVEPGCDPFTLARGSAPDGGDCVRLLSVATVTPRKGLPDLVSALSRLRAARRWRLDVVGSTDRDPDHVRQVRAAIAAAGLDDRIRLVGEVDESDLPRWYDEADGMVLASRHEGYGMSLAEALMHGLPVVATQGGAIAATVDGAARLVPVGDVVALSRAIADTLLDDGGRGRQAALARRWREARLETAGWPAAARRFAAALAD